MVPWAYFGAKAMSLKAEIPSFLAFGIFFKSDLPIDLTIFDSVNCAMCIRPSGTMQGSHRFIQTFQDIEIPRVKSLVNQTNFTVCSKAEVAFLFLLWCVYLELTANARLMCSINVV